jgi:hypothetical protein
MRLKTKPGGRLTLVQKLEIRSLRREGLALRAIVRKTGCAWNTVKMWCGRNPEPPIFPAEEILALLRQRVEQHEIGKRTGVPFRTIREFARANGFAQPRVQVSDEELREIISDITHRRGSGAAIAKRHRVSYKFVLNLAHFWLQCSRFLPSYKTPLESYFPSVAPPSIKETPDVFVQFVAKICETYFGGALPKVDDAKFVAAMIAGNRLLSGQPEPVLASFALGLVQALDCLRRERAMRWAN